MVNWTALQKDVGEWAEENFGDQPAVNPFLGTAEEISELAQYLLENDVEKGGEEELDAIGDILVFFADFCYRYNISYDTAAKKRNTVNLYTECDTLEKFCLEMTISRGEQAYSILKQDQGIRLEREGVGPEADMDNLAHTLRAIEVFAESRGYSLDDAVEEAWGEVKDREWDSNYN